MVVRIDDARRHDDGRDRSGNNRTRRSIILGTPSSFLGERKRIFATTPFPQEFCKKYHTKQRQPGVLRNACRLLPRNRMDIRRHVFPCPSFRYRRAAIYNGKRDPQIYTVRDAGRRQLFSLYTCLKTRPVWARRVRQAAAVRVIHP